MTVSRAAGNPAYEYSCHVMLAENHLALGDAAAAAQDIADADALRLTAGENYPERLDIVREAVQGSGVVPAAR